MHYFIVPIKDLYNIDYYSGLQAFEYKNAYGIQFNHKKDNEYRTGFIIFGYGNSTDPMYQENIFDSQNSFTFKPSNYIKIENNIFCYYLVHIQITELPNTSTGIKVLKASNSEQLKVGDLLLINDEIKITYSGNKDDIPRGNFIVGFVPFLKGAEKNDLNECSSDMDIFGEQVNNENNIDEYYGRTAHFKFSVFGCFKNCKDCDIKGLTVNDQKCKSCLDGYYFVENSQNCFKKPPNGYYFNKEKEVFSKCYDYCSKCTEAPKINNKGEVTNMNCDLCDEVKGYYLIAGTKNCEDKNKVYEKNNCPKEKPISKNNNCVLEYCTKEEYENKICSISNSVIKTQWIGDFPYICTSDSQLYSTLGQISNDEVIVESNSGNPLTDRKMYYLNEDGRGYIDGDPSQIIDLKSPYFSTYGNAAIVYINGHKCFLRLSYHESIEIYDLNENKNTSAKLEDILGYEVKSYKNSLLRTNEENTFIYAYITRGNYLIMQKLKVVSNNASNCIQIIKTSLETVKTINKNSRRCLITVNQFIECLDMDENQMYVIRIYDSNLNYLRQDELEKNKAPMDRAFYTYHEAKLLKEETGIFVYFNDISDYNAKPIFILKKLTFSNGIRNLENMSPSFSSNTLYNTLPYYISDSENSLAIINDHFFALASITAYENRHLLIVLLKVINDEKTIYVSYYDIPIKDLYDISYYSNLESFGYKNGFGVKFDQKKGNEYKTGFILFGFGNSTDPTPINNIFINDETYTFNPSDYIKIENNIFCYVFDGVVITDIPDASTGIKVLKVSNSQELKVGDFLSINEEIKITYTGNKDDIPRGKYIVGYKPHLKQPDEDKFSECSVDSEIFGENVPKTPNQDEYYGRTTHFEFTIGECFENCQTCLTKGNNLDDQKCETCTDNFYFIENTKNCFEKPPEGYYFNEEKKEYSKCYDKCKTCSQKNNGNFQNCLTCQENYLLYNSTNCLDCKSKEKYVNYEQTECITSVPDGYYANNTKYNTIDKCHQNCLTCNKAPLNDDNMNCLTCDNTNEFYKVENTNNCEKYPYTGHYLEENILKKCHIACVSCSSKPILNENGDVTNCDICNKDLGFYQVDNSKVCRNTTKEGEYFDEDCKCYKKCYKDCLTCSGKEIDEYHMNCLNCDESKGYTYFSKTTNCLNCKSDGKYVNFEETECTDDISKTNICYEKCKTCSSYGDETSMNCLTCIPGFYLKDGNCVKTYTCPYKFFYQIKIDQNADMNQKICLNQNEVCPCALPFYYPHTNECVETCPLELLFNLGCKISNLSYGLSKVISLVKLYFSEGIIDYFTKTLSLNDIDYLYELAVKISVYSLFSSYSNFFRNLEMVDKEYQSFNNDNLGAKNESNHLKGSDIDLGPCEQKLREYYNIPDDVQLTIIKVDLKKNDSSLNNVQYEVFNPRNRSNRLDLTICNEEKIIIKNTIDSSLNLRRISYMMESANNSIEIFSEDSQFFKDECSIFTSEYKTDVLIQDRYIEYNINNKICQSGCSLQKINITTAEAFCSCQPIKGFTIINETSDIEEIIKNNNVLDDYKISEEVNYQKYSNVNAKTLKCARNIGVDFFKNYILIIFSILLFGYIFISILQFIFSSRERKSNEKKNNSSKINNKNNKESNNNAIKNKKKDKQLSIKEEVQNTSKIASDDELERKNRNKSSKNSVDQSEGIKEKASKNESDYTFLRKFFSSFKKRILIFYYPKKKDFYIKLFLLIYALLNAIVTNAFFFTEKNIHQIYLDKGKYNFKYQIKYNALAALISFLFILIAKLFINFNDIYTIKEEILEKSRCIFIGLSNCLFIFYWIYLGSLTSTYINAKKHLFINAFITTIFLFVKNLLLALVSSILREKSFLRKIIDFL